jgi:transcription initiation factor IIE alpha subunit
MAKSYIEIKRIIQPLYERYRNTYRGPRSSEKENLEMNKIYIDLKRLDEKIDYLNNKVYQDVRIMVGQVDPETYSIHTPYEDGSYYLFDDLQFEYYGDSATPDYLQIDTTLTISSKMSKMLQKIKRLEKGQ